MTIKTFYKVIITCCLLLQVFVINAAAGQTSEPTGQNDTISAGEKESIHSFYAGAGYGNNLFYLGTTMSQDHGFCYGSLSYGLADQFYVSATAYTVNGFSPFIAFYNLGLSYNHTFNSWFDISANLLRYNIAGSLRDTLFNNFTYADATVGFDWRILYSKVTTGFLYSDSLQFYLQTTHSRYFETPSFAHGKAFFSFDPYINILFSKMITMETSDGSTTTVSPGFRSWKTNNSGSYTRYTESFGPTEIDFGLPIAFNYDFFTIEMEPGYVLPFYSDTGSAGTKGFLFTASIFFRIF